MKETLGTYKASTRAYLTESIHPLYRTLQSLHIVEPCLTKIERNNDSIFKLSRTPESSTRSCCLPPIIHTWKESMWLTETWFEWQILHWHRNVCVFLECLRLTKLWWFCWIFLRIIRIVGFCQGDIWEQDVYTFPWVPCQSLLSLFRKCHKSFPPDRVWTCWDEHRFIFDTEVHREWQWRQ